MPGATSSFLLLVAMPFVTMFMSAFFTQGSTLLLAVHPLSRGDRRTAARRSRTARCAVEEDEHAKAVQQWVQDVVIGFWDEDLG